MSTSARQSVQMLRASQQRARSNGENRGQERTEQDLPRQDGDGRGKGKPRVFVAAENRLLLEALSRMLAKQGDVEVVGTDGAEPFRGEGLLECGAEVLLLTSQGSLSEDLPAIRSVRTTAPNVQILLIGVTGEETEFLQCVRAGIRGYLPKDASAEDVVEGVKALHVGKAVCPGTLCGALFHYFEREAASFPSASVHQRLGLTRREQQLIPLIAEGLTNKEIANRFCLSEQTVKNHLYRMKHKVGADGRLGIVHVCRTQGFMV
jgi:DNA-binding NarL/FixJ family response regulator